MKLFRYVATVLLLSACTVALSGGYRIVHREPPVKRRNWPAPQAVEVYTFKRCKAAIDSAYQKLVRFKVSRPHGVGYDNWTALNKMLAKSISAMQDSKYQRCVRDVQKLITYMQRHKLVVPFQCKRNCYVPKPTSSRSSL